MLTHRFCCDHCKKAIRRSNPTNSKALPRGWSRIEDESNGTTLHACSFSCLCLILTLRAPSEVSVRLSGASS